MIVSGSNLSMTRGDSESITVTMYDPDVVQINFNTGDEVVFSVKTSVNVSEYSLQKTVTNFTSGKAVIDISPSDTSSLPFGNYIYDIQLTRVDGTVLTLIVPSRFTISSEVTI